MNWKEQVEVEAKRLYPFKSIEHERKRREFIKIANWAKEQIQAAALPKSEEEIKKLAEKEYPTEDARKNMFHDNLGQYERQEAFIKGFKAALPVKEEPYTDRGNSNTDGVKKLL